MTRVVRHRFGKKPPVKSGARAGNNCSTPSTTAPMIPPSCRVLVSIRTSQSQIDQLADPSLGPGNEFSASMVVSPEEMACLPNSSWTTTLMTQLKMMNHRRVNPALAPMRVVAINSPEPTIDAERIKPGPKWRRLAVNVSGGARMPLEHRV